MPFHPHPCFYQHFTHTWLVMAAPRNQHGPGGPEILGLPWMQNEGKKAKNSLQTLVQVPAPALTVLWLILRVSPQRPGTVGWVTVLALSKATFAGQTGAKNTTHPYTSDPCGLQSHYLCQGQVLWATRVPGSTCLGALLAASCRPSASYTLPSHSTSEVILNKKRR